MAAFSAFFHAATMPFFCRYLQPLWSLLLRIDIYYYYCRCRIFKYLIFCQFRCFCRRRLRYAAVDATLASAAVCCRHGADASFF